MLIKYHDGCVDYKNTYHELRYLGSEGFVYDLGEDVRDAIFDNLSRKLMLVYNDGRSVLMDLNLVLVENSAILKLTDEQSRLIVKSYIPFTTYAFRVGCKLSWGSGLVNLENFKLYLGGYEPVACKEFNAPQ